LQGIDRFDFDSPHFNYLSQINPGSFTPSSEAMAEKTLLEFSAPNINNTRKLPVRCYGQQNIETNGIIVI
jgi:hypothetical protein